MRKGHNKEPLRKKPAPVDKDDEVLAGLLSRFHTFLFKPEPEVLQPEALDRLVQTAMARRPALSKARKRRIIAWSAPVLLRMAALFMVCLLGGVWLVRETGRLSPGDPASGHGPFALMDVRTAVPNLVGMIGTPPLFRGGVADPAGSHLYDPAWPPVAYLFRDTVEILVQRESFEPQRIETPCFLLAAGDRVQLSGEGQATILFPGRVVTLRAGGIYTIGEDGLVMRSPDEKPIMPDFIPAFPVAIQPAALLREGAPPAAAPAYQESGNVVVLSPLGDTFSPTPSIVWLGNDQGQVRLVLSPVGTESGIEGISPLSAHAGGGGIAWDETGWPPLPRGSAWRLALLDGDGEIAAADFRVLHPADAAGYTGKLDLLAGGIANRQAWSFAEACLFLDGNPACAAEGRLAAMRLWKSPAASGNIVYMALALRAYEKLGMPEGVRQMQLAIHASLNAVRRQESDKAGAKE